MKLGLFGIVSSINTDSSSLGQRFVDLYVVYRRTFEIYTKEHHKLMILLASVLYDSLLDLYCWFAGYSAIVYFQKYMLCQI